ncbi:cation-transporting P-type ATPase [Lapidilactobacillus mulanensis]|uniref:Cation-transporting P-type ATPase n=1 Tax=Lapidilactobacillus mulanensis TaxID=2485999 RepID=A0ABW4DRV8_9LACO|nr:cation-transporting P-type ATPase [Lapidilactobacillus mulanensis]
MVSEKISGRSNFEAQFAEKSGLTQEQVQQKRAQFGVNEIPVHEDNPLMGTLKRL